MVFAVVDGLHPTTAFFLEMCRPLGTGDDTSDGMACEIGDHTACTTRKQARGSDIEFQQFCRTPKREQYGVASPNSSSGASMLQGFAEKSGAQTPRIQTSTAKSEH
ncbi:hypothetical protein [Nocardia sp. NPDC049707]|uniref:hypothetical protein n=1 Tax=Nocardia sp. NPDC049707 TaxID=3154735 RepID=UPI003421FC73